MNIFLRYFSKKYIRLFCVSCIFLFPAKSFSQVQINSITTTPSTCPNNGSITVTAKNSNTAGSLFYSITAGPVTEPVQTNNVFNSLPSGTYRVTVSDGGANSATQNATITGSYLNPDFIPTAVSPYCKGGSDGQIICNRVAGTGNGPFSWQLIAPSPVITAPQANDTFSNLSPGNYTVRLTDACGSFRTIVATVTDQIDVNLAFLGSPSVEIIGCDSGLLTTQFDASLFRFPYTYTFITDNGTVTTTTPSTFKINDTNGSGGGYIIMQQWLPNYTYGKFIEVIIKDNCGNTITSSAGQARTFNFCWNYSPHYVNCQYLTSTLFGLSVPNCVNPGDIPTYFDVPLKYNVINTVTNQIADSGTIVGDPTHNWVKAVDEFYVKPLPNGSYRITITDACGNEWDTYYNITNAVSPPPEIVSQGLSNTGCIDSVSTLYVNVDHFTSDPVLVMLSGPSTLGSTKPGYTYHSNYVYPDTSSYSEWQGAGVGYYGFVISDLSVGKYMFDIIDTCGVVIHDSITVTPPYVTDLHNQFWYKKGCLGQNQIHYSFNTGSGEMYINNLAGTYSNNKFYQSNGTINDSLVNIPSGTYHLSFVYNAVPGAIAYYGTPQVYCTTIYDTLIIQGYETPSISTVNYVECKGGTTIVLTPDSTKGITPYNYEIISGPQTFPVQSSNFFPVTLPGTYTARIFDTCGNGSTAQITVDTIASPPPDRIMFDCNSAMLYNNSTPYYTYIWTKPNSTTYVGDTLAIAPITAADTGIYHIERITNFNGCKDTTYTSYHLALSVASSQTVQYCNGTTVTVGTSVYNSPGIYIDTFKNVLGCDSIVTTSLVVFPQKKDTNNVTICKGSSITVQGNVYDSTGFYKDSVQNNLGCYDLIFTNLTVQNFRDTMNETICSMDSFVIRTNVYKNPGVYIVDTLKSQFGCDSIIFLNLTVAPPATYTLLAAPLTQVICAGENYTLGGHAYNQTGTYLDTLPVDCNYYIVPINLTVNPYKIDSIVENLCAGSSYTIGTNRSNTHTYTTTGIYRDTVPTIGCDSIIILNLNIGHYKQDTVNVTICSLDSFTVGSNVYKNPGTYIDTLSTSVTGCDSIVVLNLSITLPTYNVIATPVSEAFCIGDSFQIGNKYYTQPGTYQDSIPFLNCTEFIFTVNITVNPSPKDSIVENICSGQSFTVGTNTYTATGIYYDTLYTAVTACDSIVILNLTVGNYKKDSIVQSICAGQSYLFNGNAYTQTGIYRDTLSTTTCDSIVILNLTVNPYKKDSIVQTICAGQSYLFSGNEYTQSGIYRDTLSTTTCDSIAILNLTVGSCTPPPCPLINNLIINTGYNAVTQTQVAPGQNDPNWIVTGLSSDMQNSLSFGTDNTTNYIQPPANVATVPAVAIGQPALAITTYPGWSAGSYISCYPGNTIYTPAPAAVPNIQNVTNCTMSIARAFTIYSSSTQAVTFNNLTIAADNYLASVVIDAGTANAQTLFNTGAFSLSPSITIPATTINLTPGNHTINILCSNVEDPNVTGGNGVYYPISGQQQSTYEWNPFGIAVTGNITAVNNVLENNTCCTITTGAIDTSICPGQNYWGHTTTGTYIDKLVNIAGCDSVRTLHLTVNNYKKDSINETICAGQSFTFSGNAYTQTGIYRDTLSTVNCDSIVVLNLTVDNYKKDSINEAICAGQIFTFNGNAYTQQNIYRDTIPTTTCDSIVTLNLIVYPAPSIKIITSSTEVSKGETIQLNTTETAYSYLWTSMEMIDNNTVQDPKAIINNSVWIFLQATDDVTDCPASDSVYIFVRPGSTDSTISPCTGSYIYVPNAFTPNNDNLNDIFKPVANNITLQDFQIYNRWGQMVFETTDIHKGWNGTFQGQLADVGNYVYWLSYFDCTNTSKPKTIKGNIILIR